MQSHPYTYFNSRLCTRGNSKHVVGESGFSWFQFTPLHERQYSFITSESLFAYFNSRLCMRGNNSLNFDRVFVVISILASAWEATYCFWHLSSDFRISIHASTWEAAVVIETFGCEYIFQFMPLHERQPALAIANSTTLLFQFTPLHERQPLLYSNTALIRSISILASAWEATLARSQADGIRYFNSRLCMRGNEERFCIDTNTYKFQFTPLHERQLGSQALITATHTFQFTPLHERQLHATPLKAQLSYFNSRLYMRGNSC